MAWNQETSRNRVCAHLAELKDITVAPLLKEADLDSLLTERNCRQIYGAHIYAHPTEFSGLASMSIKTDPDVARFRQMVRGVHIYQREVSRIVESDFDATRVHFQGVRLHSLTYRPIRNAAAIARRAFLQMLVLEDFVRNVYNPAFADLPDVTLMAGASQGEAIGTRNGEVKDRELLFLGSPANHAAKILRTGALCITQAVYENLTDEMRTVCFSVGSGIYQIATPAFPRLEKWLADQGISWSRQKSRRRVEEDKEQFPLDVVRYSEAREKIDFDSLGITNNKRVRTVTLYGDVTGFTAYIDSVQTEQARQEALRLFHLIRREMARIVRLDYEGVRVQFQGDRVQAIFHVPVDKFADITLESVFCSGALQASLETVIKPLFASAASLHLAVGCDLGEITASNLGTRGHRDRICLGRSVEAAAAREEALDGGQTGISDEMYRLLPAALQKIFAFDEAKRCYVAGNRTVIELKRLIDAETYKVEAQHSIQSGPNGVQIKPANAATVATSAASRIVSASSSYASQEDSHSREL